MAQLMRATRDTGFLAPVTPVPLRTASVSRAPVRPPCPVRQGIRQQRIRLFAVAAGAGAAAGAQEHPQSYASEASASASPSSSPPPPPPPSLPGVVWERVAGCDVVRPATATASGSGSDGGSSSAPPRAVLHFVGGFAVGAKPRTTYAELLEQLVLRGDVAVVATPLPADPTDALDHLAIARAAARDSSAAVAILAARWNLSWVPVFGVGHSLGAKIHILANSDPDARAALGPRVANILLAYNNYSASMAIPQLDLLRTSFRNSGIGSGDTKSQLADILSRVSDVAAAASTAAASSNEAVSSMFGSGAADFISGIGSTVQRVGDILASDDDPISPTPVETRYLVREQYAVDANLIVSYTNDTLDCATELVPVLRDRFGQNAAIQRTLRGSHVTPLTPPIDPSGPSSVAGRRTGYDQIDVPLESVDRNVSMAAQNLVQELDDTITVMVAFIQFHLERLEQRRAIGAKKEL